MRFSLLLATVQRTQDVSRLLKSLSAQTHKNFEVLVIDQNADNRLIDVLEHYKDRLAIIHIKSGTGLSKARNVGLLQASGEVVALPDDDCWYEPDTLARVAELLTKRPSLGGVTGKSINQDGWPSLGRWDKDAGLVDRQNAWRRAISYTMFLRRGVIPIQGFDETLGVGSGTLWGAGEETEILLRILQAGTNVWYDPTLTVRHPQSGKMLYDKTARRKAHSYGRGMGRVLRLHGYALPAVGYHLARPLIGTVVSLLTGRGRKASYHWAIFDGRLRGWLDSQPRIFPAPLEAGSTLE